MRDTGQITPDVALPLRSQVISAAIGFSGRLMAASHAEESWCSVTDRLTH